MNVKFHIIWLFVSIVVSNSLHRKATTNPIHCQLLPKPPNEQSLFIFKIAAMQYVWSTYCCRVRFEGKKLGQRKIIFHFPLPCYGVDVILPEATFIDEIMMNAYNYFAHSNSICCSYRRSYNSENTFTVLKFNRHCALLSIFVHDPCDIDGSLLDGDDHPSLAVVFWFDEVSPSPFRIVE